MPQALSVLDGDTFCVSDLAGDIDRHEVHGLFRADTRYLCHLTLRINGAEPILLTGGEVDYYSAAFYLTNPDLPDLARGKLSIIRHRFVGDGMHEDISVINHGDQAVNIQLKLQVATDFADIFEVRECCVNEKAGLIDTHGGSEEGWIGFTYSHDGFSRGVTVAITEPFAWDEAQDEAAFDIALEPHESWKTCIEVALHEDQEKYTPKYACGDFNIRAADIEGEVKEWRTEVPWLATDWDDLMHVWWQGIDDLAALRLKIGAGDNPHRLIAAGLPWYMTIFGRDTLITAYQSISLGPDLAIGALEALGEFQGQVEDDFKEEEPGKILHEIRFGELATRGQVPHRPYYGTVDATPLFIILASEVYRWTADAALLHRLKEPLLAALKWMDEYGDRGGNGYIEYQRRSPKGLVNQGWKDSGDSIRFADGRLAQGPIALCEVQGYVYDAKLRLAEIASLVWQDEQLAERLKEEARQLRERFNRDFWIDRRGGYYALALDGEKRQVDSMTSNMGHLLWSGIVDQERAALIRDRLMSEPMLSRWGVRTMSAEEAGYSPIAYHNGTVWPHDNSIIAAGLRRYGFAEDANKIISAMVLASRSFDYRLPEVFAGYTAANSMFPVEYPTTCSPQAWAAASPMLFITTMLGLTPGAGDDEPRLDPSLPEGGVGITLTGLPFKGRFYDLRAGKDGTSVTESSPAAGR